MEVLKDFNYYKKKKLKSKLALRVMNTIGMVAWKQDQYGDAKQHLRLIHPVSWVWFALVIVYSIFAQGIPSTISDLKYVFKEETVLW